MIVFKIDKMYYVSINSIYEDDYLTQISWINFTGFTWSNLFYKRFRRIRVIPNYESSNYW